MIPRRVVELAAFQAVWLVCALGAAQGANAPGLVASAGFVAAQLLLHSDRTAIVATTLASGVAGLAVETLLTTAGLVRYAAQWPDAHIAPPWIVALWLAFGSTMPTTAKLLGRRPIIEAAMLGALFGPLSYAAGVQLGALHLAHPQWIGYAALGFAWSVMFPGLIAIAGMASAAEQNDQH